MNDPELSCQEDHRREDVRAASLFGLDYVEVVSDDQLTLYVYFLGKAPQNFQKQNLVLSGGRRIRDVQIEDLRVHRTDPTFDDYLEVLVNKPGDFSTYTLSVVQTDGQGQPTGQPMAGFDSRHDSVDFTFKAGCPSDLDCLLQNVCPPPVRTQPEINYLAKDYESFRQLMLDRLALIMPAWNESHAPDLGITLVELLAYAADYLSYFQDAVATEAYLGTARERISVRRHARLVDYAMHEGCNARAWLTIKTDSDQHFDPFEIYFITALPGAGDNHFLTESDLENVPSSAYEVFEPLPSLGGADSRGTIYLYAAHNEINFYAWGDCRCCLARGATSATLTDQWVSVVTDTTGGTTDTTGTRTVTTPGSGAAAYSAASTGEIDGPPGTKRLLQLKAGDILIFEEVIGPKTGNSADADPKHRQAVRLTAVTPDIDPLYHPYIDSFGKEFGQPVLQIEWDAEDSLTFPLCVSSQNLPPDCGCMENVSVARGNVILVDNGHSTGEPLGTVPTQSASQKCPSCCQPGGVEIFSGTYRPVLTQQPLTFSQPLPAPCSAADFIVQDPRQALPWISLTSIPPGPGCASVGQHGGSGTGPTAAENPVSVAPPPCKVEPLFTFDDLVDPAGRAEKLHQPVDAGSQFLLAQLSAPTRQLLADWDGTSSLPDKLRAALISDLKSLLETWAPKKDLLESGPDDPHFVVEVDNNGYAHLRFGDGQLGRRPGAGSAFRANYRIGNGQSGNVGAETITYIVSRNEKISGVTLAPRNPLPATGGADPEPIDEVKRFAPYAFKNELERAITAADYASIAQDNARRRECRSALQAGDPGLCGEPFINLQRAKAVLRWTGSWYDMMVAIDPEGSEDAGKDLIDEITIYLQPFRRIGYDLLVAPAQYAPLSVALTVCVQPNYLRGHVEAAVLDVLSNRVLPDGRLGFFHPDNLTFGDGIYVSRLIAAVQSVPGVQNVKLTELERFESNEPPADVPGEEVPAHSVLKFGPLEIARLDNDPNLPENGRLALDVKGGR